MNTIIVLSLLGLTALFTGVYNLRKWLLPLMVIGLGAALVINYFDWNTFKPYYNDMLLFDNYAVAFTGLLCAITLIIFFLCNQYYNAEAETNLGDIYALI